MGNWRESVSAVAAAGAWRWSRRGSWSDASSEAKRAYWYWITHHH
ncbi:hypothetical protein Zm00014a_024862 [Zea mays]|uniref:Uncharacterized protein n=1 Tax=Zea mays TaxID=4577 RepID=A0A3L6DHH8_MAIZE|nr:hypothetical protein Zm00014a_024862 [Zea mays]